jgi:serine/threonine protein kinase
MSDESKTLTPDPDDRLAEAIASFEEARDAGQTPEPNDWLARYPDVATRLEEFFANAGHLRQLTAPPRTPASGPEHFPIICGYEILERLGRGGMGDVYKAWQPSLDRVVALKVIRADKLAELPPAERREWTQRFRQEAEAIAGVDHPHIVPIYEIGEQDGLPFYSMKYVEGGSLKDCLQQYATDPRLAARLLATVARAMHHAHQRGFLHRDLKPGNILLRRKSEIRNAKSEARNPKAEPGIVPGMDIAPSDFGFRISDLEPMVTDFGLVKRIERDGSLTQTGALMGTPEYMAPEQARAEKRLSTAADVYSLGAVLYALLTGRPPFKGDNLLETLQQVVEREPEPPRKLNPKVPPDLEIICLKCLEKEPHKRYASAEELAGRLQLFLEYKPIPDRPVSHAERLWRWCRRNPRVAVLMTAFVASLLAGTAIASYFAVQASSEAEAAQRSAEWAKKEAESAYRRLYIAEMRQAQRTWEEGQLDRLKEILEGLRPERTGGRVVPCCGGKSVESLQLIVPMSFAVIIHRPPMRTHVFSPATPLPQWPGGPLGVVS